MDDFAECLSHKHWLEHGGSTYLELPEMSTMGRIDLSTVSSWLSMLLQSEPYSESLRTVIRYIALAKVRFSISIDTAGTSYHICSGILATANQRDFSKAGHFINNIRSSTVLIQFVDA